MRVEIEESRKLRRASASMRDDGVIYVKVPRHWPRATKQEVIQDLVDRLNRKDAREKALLQKKAAQQERVTITTQPELEQFVRQINAETFNAPLGKIRLGNSRYNHLAQVNLRTQTMTVSRYCLNNAPAQALRYLIIHELAHFFEGGHGPKFWALVARHVPDYRLQSRIMKAFHHQCVIGNGHCPLPHSPSDSQQPTSPKPAATQHGEDPSASAPASQPVAERQAKKDTGRQGWAGVFQQLFLWDDRKPGA